MRLGKRVIFMVCVLNLERVLLFVLVNLWEMFIVCVYEARGEMLTACAGEPLGKSNIYSLYW